MTGTDIMDDMRPAGTATAAAVAKIAAGASLVQCYTGLVYRGPALVGACVEALRTAGRRA